MEKRHEYKSTIKSRPFLFLETRKVSDLIYQGFKAFEIKDKAIQENIFQVKTEARKREIASIILSRLKDLDSYLIEKVGYGDSETSKMLVLYSIMRTDQLFFEFMYEVFREKLVLKEQFLTDKDFNIFFDTKKQQSHKVASWNDYTFYKLKQVYIRILYEAGLLKNQKGDREINRVYLDFDVIEHLREQGEQLYIEILAGE